MTQIEDISKNTSFSEIHQFLSTFYISLLSDSRVFNRTAER